MTVQTNNQGQTRGTNIKKVSYSGKKSKKKIKRKPKKRY